jgi:hypothetical protein
MLGSVFAFLFNYPFPSNRRDTTRQQKPLSHEEKGFCR